LPAGVARRTTALALAILLAACAPLPTRPSAGPLADVPDDVQPVSTTSLSRAFGTRAIRIDVADRAWRVIAGHFYDPKLNGVDWEAVRRATRARAGAATTDAEFYTALKDMAAALGDSHTMVLTPRETLDRRRFVSTRIGMQMTFVDGRIVIAEVEPDSPAGNAGIAVGDVL
jgi:C-terminal processing protease CtpA/Prc